MSTQADVHSIDSLKEFRVALALFSEEALSALGSVDMEVRRTIQWLQHDRREYWQQQIKRRREQVAQAKAEVFRRKLAKTADYTPAMSEQKELLRRAEASLQDAETRAALVKKWEPALQQAALEYRASTRRISNFASGDVPRAAALLDRLIDALEGYLRVALPSSSSTVPAPSLATITDDFLRDDPGPKHDADLDEPAPELESDGAGAVPDPE
jgi:hypothetical protein